MSLKIIVAHPGKQHSFRSAIALKQKSMLLYYITTVYDNNNILMRFIKTVFKGDNAKRASSRKCPELVKEEVIQFNQIPGLVTLLLLRIDKSKNIYARWNDWVADRFGIRVAKFAIKNEVDAVIMYDSNAAKGFAYLEKNAPNIVRVLDASHSNRLYEKKVYLHDMEVLPEWAEKLHDEKPYMFDRPLNRIKEENKRAQYFIVPSDYVKRSYVKEGIKTENIKIVHYGVAVEKFKPIEDHFLYKEGKDLFLVFVGNVGELKGIGHLLNAMRIVNKKYPSLKVHIVGGTVPEEINKKYGNPAISHGYVLHDEMADILRKADVMVFPSLSEGMTLSGLEALASGIPVICTVNSGINDLIIDGKNGYVIPVSDTAAVAEKIIWFVENPEQIPDMKRAAREVALKYTWEHYYEEYANTMLSIINECRMEKS